MLDNTGSVLQKALDRRRMFKGLGAASIAAAAAGVAGGSFTQLLGQQGGQQDSPSQIMTAALIAEDLATVFYYNGLIGKVIQDPALAGPGGTAVNPDQPPNGNPGNVDYLRAALTEEIDHANFWRGELGNAGKGPNSDPYQTFYFPSGTFDTLPTFIATLEGLENAFIGAYLVAVREFVSLAVNSPANQPPGPQGGPFNTAQLGWFAQVAASILGVESEHRVLGNVINNVNPANNLCYESTDGLLSVYNGPNSAVAALTPYLTPSTGPAYSFMTAVTMANTVSLPCTGSPPKF